MEHAPTPEDDDDFIINALQGLVADEIKSQVPNALATIADKGKELIGSSSSHLLLVLKREQLPCCTTP